MQCIGFNFECNSHPSLLVLSQALLFVWFPVSIKYSKQFEEIRNISFVPVFGKFLWSRSIYVKILVRLRNNYDIFSTLVTIATDFIVNDRGQDEQQSCKVLSQYHSPFRIYDGGSTRTPSPRAGGCQKSPGQIGLKKLKIVSALIHVRFSK